MENAPVSRFIDSKTNKSKKIHFVEKLYNLFITEGAVDQGYPIDGLQSIPDSILSSFPKNKVEIKTNEEVIKIHGDEEIEGVDTKNESYDCDTVIYSGPSSYLPALFNNFPKTYVKNLKSIKHVNSLTIWLGLHKKIFDNIGSEMWIHSDPFAWVSSMSNYNPKLAPKGKQLAGFSFVLPNEYNSENIKKKALNTIFDTIPDIENSIDMIHYQELVPEKASWDLNSGFGDVKTPIKKLYTVGTDTVKRSSGICRAAYSVLKCLEIMKSDELL